MNLVFKSLGGNCPVQAEGTVDGIPFYFRARGTHWSMSIGEDPVGISCGYKGGWHKEAEYGDEAYEAGWMSVEEARQFIYQCAEEYMKSKKTESKG